MREGRDEREAFEGSGSGVRKIGKVLAAGPVLT